MGKENYFPKVKDVETASETLEEILGPTSLEKSNFLSDRFDAEIYL